MVDSITKTLILRGVDDTSPCCVPLHEFRRLELEVRLLS